jgi:hypothetical protein
MLLVPAVSMKMVAGMVSYGEVCWVASNCSSERFPVNVTYLKSRLPNFRK